MSIGASKRVDFPVVGSFSDDIVRKIDAQRTINLYEIFEPTGKKQNILVPTPGLEEKTEAVFSGGGVFRAATFHFDKTLAQTFAYFCVGDSIYKMSSGLTVTSLGPPVFTTTTGHVGVDANENQIMFVDGVDAILFDEPSQVLSTIVIPNTPGAAPQIKPQDITFMDGYLIVAAKEDDKFFVSDLNNGALWKDAAFALVNSHPAILQACVRLKRRIFLFGSTISELWRDAGTAVFPFRRDNNLLFEHGVESPASVSEGFDRLFYLSRDRDGVGGIMMVAGTVPQKISPRTLDETIQTLINTNLASGFVYKVNGQIFYQINFTTSNRTFIYGVDTDKWHEMEMLTEARHLGETHVFFNNRHYLGSYLDNKLYDFSNDFLTNAGEAIKRTRICRNFNSETYNRIRIDRLQLDMLQGIGLANPTGSPPNEINNDDPQVHLSISEDGAITFHNFGQASIGKIGKRLTRTIWRRLGVRRDSTVKFEMFNSIPFYILGGAIDIEVLPE